MDITHYMHTLGKQARAASSLLGKATTEAKNTALRAIAQQILDHTDELLSANHQDVMSAQSAGLDAAMLDRLKISTTHIESMAQGLVQIAELPDPVNEISDIRNRPSGIQVGRMRTPLGVIGIIYEARPNVTADAAGLCLKSGNAVILRGGKEALQTNRRIALCIQQGLLSAHLPGHSVQLVETTDRDAVKHLLEMKAFVDIIVPRGGKSLIERVTQEAKIPVIKHLDGNCHIYIDEFADHDNAIDIVENAKTQRYGTCNTTESLLINRAIAPQILPRIAARLHLHGVELRLCPTSWQLLQDSGSQIAMLPATEADWSQEYLAPILSVKLVDHLEHAIAHINHYSSGHTEAILTTRHDHAMRFLREVDSSSVMINASTRFADGFEYGLGAEIGISTDKIHARGPVGLEGLTSQKWIVLGHGEIRR